jgi:membrane-associated phospholipid phosphatase
VPIFNFRPGARRLHFPLHSTDRLLLGFWGLLSLASLALRSRIPHWEGVVAANAGAAVLVLTLAYVARKSGSKVLALVHEWSSFLLVIFTFKQLYFIIGPIHQGKNYDPLLIALDYRMFGVNPTEWLVRFSTPWLTEVLQIAYSLFYVLFLAVGFELYRKDFRAFQSGRFAMVYGFLLSYVGYFFLPSVGPRFTLHDFSRLDIELPGLLFTPALRWFVNIFEAIHPGMSNSVAMASAQRDVFPSGHTMMTIVTIALAYQYKLRIRSFVLVLGFLLILATVYLRYHYLIDVLAGIVLACLCLLTHRKIKLLLGADE